MKRNQQVMKRVSVGAVTKMMKHVSLMSAANFICVSTDTFVYKICRSVPRDPNVLS